MKDSPPLEISAESAGKLLSTSSKTVRNLISRKKLKAKKVAGKWFVDYKSVLTYQAANLEENQSTEQISLAKSFRSASPSSAGAKLRSLAAYRLCLHAFETYDWQHSQPLVKEQLERTRLLVIGEIGAGFYQFGKRKQHHYNKARSALGQMAALLDAYPEKGLEKAEQFITEECLPALGSLMRKLERKSSGERQK